MGRLTRVLLVALAATTALFAVAGPAAAEDAQIVYLERTDSGLQVTLDVPAGAEVDLDGVTTTVNGTEYDATAARLSGGEVAVQRTTVLAIDTSDSMAGARFAAAKRAADAFLASVPDDVRVGIVTFDRAVQTVLEPTTDRDAARTVVAGLDTLRRGTLLHQAVLESLELAGGEGQGSVLLLSDGADTGDTPLSEVVTAVDESDVVVDAVALEQTRTLQTLRQIAGDDGSVVAAGSGAVAEAFSDEAEVLARQVGVRIDAPAQVLGDQVSVGVSLPTSAGEVRLRSTLPAVGETEVDPSAVLAAVPEAPSSASSGPPGWLMYVGVGVFAVGLVLTMVLLVPRSGRVRVEDRVAAYAAATGVGAGPRAGAAPEGDDAAFKQASDAVAQVLRHNRSLEDKISRRLDAAGSELKPAEWLLVVAGVLVASTVVGMLVGRGNLVVGCVFLLLGAVGPGVYLRLRGARRRRKFDSMLPETLQLMAGSLSAGLSLMQSVDTVVREGADPVAGEFRRAIVETRLGVSLEDALDGIAERFDSRDFRWVVMAIRIQRQVGGNLAELLTTVAETMREREYIRRQVAALAAEGKLSAIVLGGLPPAFLLYLLVAQGDYVEPLFTDIRGIVMLVGAGLWLAVGVFWMSKLVKVEV